MSLFQWRNTHLCTIQTVIPGVFVSNFGTQSKIIFKEFCELNLYLLFLDPWSISLPNLISCELLFDALFVVVISRVERGECLIIISIFEKLLDVVQNYFWVFQLSNKSTPAGFPPDPLLWQNSIVVLVKAAFLFKPFSQSGFWQHREANPQRNVTGQTFGLIARDMSSWVATGLLPFAALCRWTRPPQLRLGGVAATPQEMKCDSSGTDLLKC